MILFYCILLVLHPRHKLNYFKAAGWVDGWTKDTEAIVRAEFDLSYGSTDASLAMKHSKSKVRVLNHIFLIKSLY
jgi:hypothetical protein